jgi:hypothetical protein
MLTRIRRALVPSFTSLLLLTILGACAGAAAPSPPAEPTVEPTLTVAPTASPPSEPQALEPGLLEPGVRYDVESLGLSFEADAEWFAVLPTGGDIALSREGVTLYFLHPQTMLQPDGLQGEVPEDLEEFADAIDATDITDVTATEPFEVEGLDAIQIDLEASGGSEAAPLLTTTTGASGLVDGEYRWIVVSTDDGPVVISVERADDPDIDETWEVAAPLLETLEPLD